MFNVATIVGAIVLVPLMPAFGVAADHRDRHRGARGRRVAGCHSMAIAPSRRIPLSSGTRHTRAGTSSGARADGAGHDRSRRDAGQSLRQHAARHQPGNGRGVVARVCLSADVSADWAVWRVDRDRDAAGRFALRRSGRPRGHAASRRAGARHDDGVVPPRDVRARDARRADRPPAVRARTLLARRHRVDGGRASLVRRRTAGVRVGQSVVAGLLRHPAEPECRSSSVSAPLP